MAGNPWQLVDLWAETERQALKLAQRIARITRTRAARPNWTLSKTLRSSEAAILATLRVIADTGQVIRLRAGVAEPGPIDAALGVLSTTDSTDPDTRNRPGTGPKEQPIEDHNSSSARADEPGRQA